MSSQPYQNPPYQNQPYQSNYEGQMQQLPQILLSSSMEIPGYQIVDFYGLVFGITVRSRGAGGQCIGNCQSCAGGEISAYVQSNYEARNESLERLMHEAYLKGANAIISVKFDSSEAGQSGQLMNIVAYGTAVKVIKKIQ